MITGNSVEEDKVIRDAHYENIIVKAQDDFYCIYDGETLVLRSRKLHCVC